MQHVVFEDALKADETTVAGEALHVKLFDARRRNVELDLHAAGPVLHEYRLQVDLVVLLVFLAEVRFPLELLILEISSFERNVEAEGRVEKRVLCLVDECLYVVHYFHLLKLLEAVQAVRI